VKYISEKVVVVTDLENYYCQVIDEIVELDKSTHKIIKYIFDDYSAITIDFKLNEDKIIDRSLGVANIRQHYKGRAI